MAKQTINLGTSLNAGDGDPLRTAFDKINDNFDELYARDLGTDPENIGTNLAPSVNGASDLGTTPQRWGTVFVRDFIDIGNGSTITVNADGEFVFNKPIISTVAVKNDIVGSIFADDSSIAFNAQTNTFFGKFDGDVTGSVYADNSTILVDGVNGTISAANLTGALPAIDGSALTGITASSVAFSNITSTPTTLAGYGIADAYTQTQVDTAITNATSSIVIQSGSTQSIDIVAADSTVLVDSVNGTLNAATLTGALPAIDGSALTSVTTAFSNITSTPTTLSGYGITDAYTQTQVDTAITNATSSIVIPSGSSQSIDVVAADSTLLVDSSNGTLNSSALTKPIELDDNEEVRFGTDNDMRIYHSGTTGNIDNNTGTLILDGATVRIQDGALANTAISAANGIATLLFENSAKLETTTDGISVTDHIALADTGEMRFGTDNDMRILHSGTSGLIQNTTGTLVIAGPIVRIQDAGTSQSAFTASNGIATLYHLNSAVLNTTAGGIQLEKGVEEKFATLTGSTGVVAHDCANGHVFYHTGATADITANFTNLNLTAEYATNLTVIINQGATPYEVTAVQIGGAAQTIEWQGGSAPIGNANGIDSFSFTILNDGGTYVVLGQMVDFT